jgi:hypothetical protein
MALRAHRFVTKIEPTCAVTAPRKRAEKAPPESDSATCVRASEAHSSCQSIGLRTLARLV